MNPRIASKLRIQTYNFGCYLTKQHNVNKRKFGAIGSRFGGGENHFFNRCLFKYTSRKDLQYASAPAYMALQKRSMSNAPTSAEKFSDLPHTEAITSKIPTDNWPELFRFFSESKIVGLAQQTLLKVHEVTGLPWWATIALTAYMMRTAITLPFHILQIRNTAKLELIKPEMKEIIKNCKREANLAVSYHGLTESTARRLYLKNVKAEYDKLIVEYNCHPFKSYVLLLIQLPVWFSFSFATRNLSYMIPRGDPVAELTYIEMMIGGFGWVKNLTDVDHYMILPITCTLLNLIIIETHILFSDPTKSLTKLQKAQRIFFRLVSLIMFPIATMIPSGTLVYWISSSSYGLLQTFLFHSSRFRRLFGVPLLEDQPKHPYRLFYSNLKSRLRLKSN